MPPSGAHSSRPLPLPARKSPAYKLDYRRFLTLLRSAATLLAPPPDPVTPPTDPASPPTDAGGAALAILDNRSPSPGIVFGTWNMPNSYLNSVHTGWLNGGPLDPSNILSWLSGARAKGARGVIKL